MLPAELRGRINVWTNINPSEKAGKIKLARMLGSPTVKPEDRVGRTFIVTAYAIHPVLSEDEKTHEVKEYYRTVLFTKDGGMLTFGSYGVAKAVASLGTFFDAKEWAEGIPLKVVSGKARGQGTWYSLEVDFEAMGTTEAPDPEPVRRRK